MGNNQTNKIESKWYHTNADKAKKLLEKYGLLQNGKGKENVEVSPTILKVLFGKDGVLRLLRDSWTTKEEISLFSSMTDFLVYYYQERKVDYAIRNLKDNSEKFEEESKKAIYDVYGYCHDTYEKIDQAVNKYHNLAKKYMDYNINNKENKAVELSIMNLKLKIRELNGAISHLNCKKNLESEQIFELMDGIKNIENDINEACNEFNNNSTGNQGDKLKKVLDGARKINQNEREIEKKTNNIAEIQKCIDVKQNSKNNLLQAYNELKTTLNKNSNDLKAKLRGIRLEIGANEMLLKTYYGGYITKAKKLCELSNEMGGRYFKEKKKTVNFLSFTANKMKLETSRILKSLKCPSDCEMESIFNLDNIPKT